MDNNYTEIAWSEVREGDVMRHENGDRLTVAYAGGMCVGDVSGRLHTPDVWGDIGFTPYRRKPEMPTGPGAFLDKDGEVVVLDFEDSHGAYWVGVGSQSWFSPGEMEHRAPFTRLVPMPTEEQVLEAVGGPDDWFADVAKSATERVMALLNGEADDDQGCAGP